MSMRMTLYRLAIVFFAIVFANHASWAIAEDGPRLKVNLSGDEFAAETQALAPRGYQPVSVSGYDVNGETNYAVVWEKRAPLPWAEHHNLRAEEFQDNFDALLGQGFRPISLSVSNVGKDVRYSGVWERRAGQVRFNSVGQSAADFQKLNEAYAEQGFRPQHVSGFTVEGEPRFSAIWEKSEDNVPSETRLNLTAENYQTTHKTFASRGYRPVSLGGYDVGGAVRYATVWEKRTGGAFEAQPTLSTDELNRVSQRMAPLGYAPVSLTGYTVAGQTHFAAIWERPDKTGG